MRPSTLLAATLGLGASALVGAAHAHPVTVDGLATEWSSRVPTSDNLGLIARTSASEGEYVWLDNAADTRTDLASPENDANITRVQYTGTTAGLAILVRLASTTPSGAPVQVQVAIDTDRVSGSGQNFLAAFADTQVANDARWEYLVQTRFGSGATASVLNSSFTSVATVSAVRGADGVEVFVPWSALGLSAPPVTPLRFTVATFRAQSNDDTVAIGGSEVSNALDVVTDYGDPRASAYPNTFAEVSDQVIQYYADVYFGTSGEVYAPLMVTRFVADAAASTAGGNEWVALRNMTPGPLALGSYRVGDEETVDGTEGMYSFPTATLAAGATYIVAASGSQYAARYGRSADAEFATTAADTTPDMTRYTLWTPSGSFGLANGGDEILVLDGSNTIVDIVNFGTGVYAGVTAAAVISTTARVYGRPSTLLDRDNNATDFSDLGVTCGPDSECGSGACTRCDLNACGTRAVGTACSDGDACNGAETCNATGVCAAGTPLVCNDGNPCTADACVAATGCVAPPADVGTPCADGNLCNGAETCNAAGACVAGTPLTCADSNPCTINACNPASGCTVTVADDGTVCGSTNVCTGRQTCGSGVCITADPLTCNDGNACTADNCNPASGCDFGAVSAGTPCADGNLCNGAETCNATGMCTAGVSLVCNDGNPCTADACNPSTGCAAPPVSAGTACSDGNACNGAETCNAAGACIAGTTPSCDDSNPCTADSCSAATGCVNAPVSAGTSCSDGNACNGAETCNAAGACASGAPPSCNDSNPCTVDTCGAATGCVNAPIAAGTACGDGNLCNGAETCNASGMCVSGAPVTCAPSTVACRVNGCDPATGGCALSNASAGTLCDDGDLCNGIETCNASGACVMGVFSDAGMCADAGDASDAADAADATDATDATDAEGDASDSGEDAVADASDASDAGDDAAADASDDAATDAGDDATTDAGDDAAIDAGDDAAIDAGEDAGDDATADAGDDAATDGDLDVADVEIDADDAAGSEDATDSSMQADARADARSDVAVADVVRGDVASDAAGDVADAAGTTPVDSSGCGCRATGSGTDGGLPLAGLAALGAVIARRRRRRA